MSFGEKVSAVFLGVNNPRPRNRKVDIPHEVIRLKSNKSIEAWMLNVPNPKGTVLICHGYGGEKASMIDKAQVFQSLGYNVMLVDFMGAGNSEGDQCTVGYYESEEVKSCVDYLLQKGEKNIVLFGTSMGAVAILKAVADHSVNPQKIVIECPYGNLLKTVQARFKTMRVPSWPMANLLVFYGGLQNGFNAFSLSPEEYAKKINCPTLLMLGGKDEKVSKEETDIIFKNLATTDKTLIIYPNAGHENYLNKYATKWTQDVSNFLGK